MSREQWRTAGRDRRELGQAGGPESEIHAWRFETQAWQVLNDGDYHHALDLSQAAQRFAPRGSSAAIQATAQEGRAWARLGQAKQTYYALKRVEGYVSRTTRPETPEHHYRYDPDKAEAYVATALAWLGDVASEHHTRHVVATVTQEAEADRALILVAHNLRLVGDAIRPKRNTACGIFHSNGLVVGFQRLVQARFYCKKRSTDL